MSAAGPYLRRIAPNAEYTGGYVHWCPGCEAVHQYTVPRWTFNGDVNRPAFTPSMLIGKGTKYVCHYFIRTGDEVRDRMPEVDPTKSYIDFCVDSSHELAGKVVPLPEWPYAPGTYGGVED